MELEILRTKLAIKKDAQFIEKKKKYNLFIKHENWASHSIH